MAYPAGGGTAERRRCDRSDRGRVAARSHRSRSSSSWRALPFMLSNFRLFQFTQVCIYAIALLGLNILTGYNGQISLGHGAFYAVGAYTTAIMIDQWNIAYGWTIPVAGIVCLVVGFLFGDPGAPAGGALPGARHLRAGPGRAADPEVLRALDGRLAGHRAEQAQGPVGPPAHRRPVAVLPDPGRCSSCSSSSPATCCAGARGRAIVAIRDNPHRRPGDGDQHRALQVADVRGQRRPTRAWRARSPPWPSPSWRPDASTCSCRSRSWSGSSSAAWPPISGAIFGALFIQFVPNWAQDISKAAPWAIYGIFLIVFMYAMPRGIAGFCGWPGSG